MEHFLTREYLALTIFGSRGAHATALLICRHAIDCPGEQTRDLSEDPRGPEDFSTL